MASKHKSGPIFRSIPEYWSYAARLEKTGGQSKVVFAHRPAVVCAPESLRVTRSGMEH
jgi:hypothetical protein